MRKTVRVWLLIGNPKLEVEPTGHRGRMATWPKLAEAYSFGIVEAIPCLRICNRCGWHMLAEIIYRRPSPRSRFACDYRPCSLKRRVTSGKSVLCPAAACRRGMARVC